MERSLPHYKREGWWGDGGINRGEIPVHLCRVEKCRTFVESMGRFQNKIVWWWADSWAHHV